MKSLRILIVDDDADDRMIFREALEEVNPEAIYSEAKNGEDALLFLKQSEELPAFIFLDLNMPRMDGKEFLSRVKKEKRLASIPIIIYTTSRSEEDGKETLALGAYCFLTKPIGFDELCSMISLVLSGRIVDIGTAHHHNTDH